MIIKHFFLKWHNCAKIYDNFAKLMPFLYARGEGENNSNDRLHNRIHSLIQSIYATCFKNITKEVAHMGVNQTSPPLPTLNIPWPLTERHFTWLARLLLAVVLLTGLFPKSMPRSRQVSTGMCVRKLPWHLRKFISFGHPVAKLVVLPSCERTTWPVSSMVWI